MYELADVCSKHKYVAESFYVLSKMGENLHLDEVEVRGLPKLLKFVKAFAMAHGALLALPGASASASC